MIDKCVSLEQCFGCESCCNICPKEAIEMKADEYGNDYPRVDYSKCVSCGLCQKVCPSLKPYSSFPVLPKVYSLRIKDVGTLHESTSGGFFTAISDYVLSKGGYVCGAVFDDDFTVHHVVTSSFEERDKMRGAKYVKSSIGCCYQKIKELLNAGQLVLFSGTSCQVHGLKMFLNKEYEGLITVDIICHGVPSLKYFLDYISFIERKYGNIKNIRFRSKNLGWRGNNLEIALKDGKTLSGVKDTKKYTNLYGGGYLMRDNCFSCPYTSVFRIGDFSIGDCWGIENTDSHLNDNKGCSLVFVNCKKAESIFNFVKKNLIYESREIPEILQPNLLSPTKKPNDYDKVRSKLVDKNYWRNAK